MLLGIENGTLRPESAGRRRYKRIIPIFFQIKSAANFNDYIIANKKEDKNINSKEKVLLRKLMTKKAYLELQKSRRVTNDFNTGTRVFKSKKNPSRQEQKKEVRNGADNLAPFFLFFIRIKLMLYYRRI